MTGTVDYLSDGERVIAIENGHELLGQVTGVRPYWNHISFNPCAN